MDEHLDSHNQAPVAEPNNMPVGADPNAQVQVAAAQPQPQTNVITWEASEHVNYNNGGGWMAGMIAGGIVLAAFIGFVVDIMSAIVILLLLGGILFYSRMKPRVLRYTVSDQGVSVGEKIYSYSEFRSFSFNQDNGVTSIFLMPLQRFMVPITMYVAPENQDEVANLLSEHLPNEQRKPDFMDRITSKLRL